MEGKILRPIPGTGYVVGELATFSDKSAAKYAEFLNDSNYFEKGSIKELEKRDAKVAAEKIEAKRLEKEQLAGKSNREDEEYRAATDTFFAEQIKKRDEEEAKKAKADAADAADATEVKPAVKAPVKAPVKKAAGVTPVVDDAADEDAADDGEPQDADADPATDEAPKKKVAEVDEAPKKKTAAPKP